MNSLTIPIAEDPTDTFEKFVWRCARRVGPNQEGTGRIMPRKVEPSYAEDVVRSAERLAALRRMGPEAIRTLQELERATYSRRTPENEGAREAKRLRFETMRVRAEAWEPPTPDHVDLKRTMMRLLQDEIERHSPRPPEECPPPKTPEAWIAERIQWAEEDLKRAKEHLNAAIAEVAEFNDWNAALEESVPQP